MTQGASSNREFTNSPANIETARGVFSASVVGIVMTMVLVFVVGGGRAHGQQIISEKAQVKAIAERRGLQISTTDNEGRTYELQKFVNGIPLYYKTFNSVAAKSVRTNLVHPGGGSGLELTGTGVRLGIWDGGAVRTGHAEFSGRASQRDGSPVLNFHATHVAGTMIAAGINASAKGMSYEALLDCHDWDDDLSEMAIASQSRGVRISNHSYGLITGWEQFVIFVPGGPEEPRGAIPVVAWIWFGDVSVSEEEDYAFGFYSFEARDWDAFAHAHPRFLWVKAAGNDRNQGPAPGTSHYFFDPDNGELVLSTAARSRDGNGGYDSVSHSATSKNGLVVGAVNDVAGGYTTPASVVMSSFSCWGPTDDGRIKPDIVGNGVGLFSSLETSNNAYGSLSGTSMASPNVSGSLGLLQQHWAQTHSTEDEMLSSTLKAIVINTADECGPSAGPDYQNGWGLLNTQRAAQLISADMTLADTITEHTFSTGQELEFVVISDATQPEVRVTICWTDPPPAVSPSLVLDNPISVLVNDLDLRMEGTSQTYHSWTLDPANPSAPAVRGDNVLDNVEQVGITKTGTQAYRLRVTHKGNLIGGSQTFSLIIRGATEILTNPEFVPPAVSVTDPADGTEVGGLPSVGVTFTEPVSGVVASQLSVNGSTATTVSGTGAGPYLFTGFAAPADGNVRVQIAGGQKDIFENLATGAGWIYTKADCNANGVFDALDVANGEETDCNGNLIPDKCDPTALRIIASEKQVMPYGQLMHLNGATLISGGKAPFTFEWTLRGNEGEENTPDESPSFQPKQPGIYVARLVATDAMGCRVIGFITVEVTGSDLAGPLPTGPVTVGGAMCPFGGVVPTAVLLFTLVGVRSVRRRSRNSPVS